MDLSEAKRQAEEDGTHLRDRTRGQIRWWGSLIGSVLVLLVFTIWLTAVVTSDPGEKKPSANVGKPWFPPPLNIVLAPAQPRVWITSRCQGTTTVTRVSTHWTSIPWDDKYCQIVFEAPPCVRFSLDMKTELPRGEYGTGGRGPQYVRCTEGDAVFTWSLCDQRAELTPLNMDCSEKRRFF